MSPDEEVNKEILLRVQQKAEDYTQSKRLQDDFQTELEAIKEVYDLSDTELKDILKSVEKDMNEKPKDGDFGDFSQNDIVVKGITGIAISAIFLFTVGIALTLVAPFIGIPFICGIFCIGAHNWSKNKN